MGKTVALVFCAALLLASSAGARETEAAERTAEQAVEPPADEPAEKPAAEDETPALLRNLRPKARLLLGVGADERDDWARRYGVQQARLGFRLDEELYRIEVEADFAESNALNDAWIELKATDELRFRIGRFKQPFGAFRLVSAWNLPLPSRPAISGVADDIGFGGRDLGATLRYRFLFVELEGGVFQGMGIGARPPRETGLVRLELKPVKAVRIGGGLGRRAIFDGGAGDAASADLRFTWSGFTALAEWVRAEDTDLGIEEEGWGLLLARRLPWKESLWIEPAVGADRLEGVGNRFSIGLGAGIEDRFVARVGARHGADGDEAGRATRFELQLGVQL